jgi:hypothetical protein
VKLSSPLHLHKGLSGTYTGILAVVPPCAGECRFVRVVPVLIFLSGRTCVGFVLPQTARSANTLAHTPRCCMRPDLPGLRDGCLRLLGRPSTPRRNIRPGRRGSPLHCGLVTCSSRGCRGIRRCPSYPVRRFDYPRAAAWGDRGGVAHATTTTNPRYGGIRHLLLTSALAAAGQVRPAAGADSLSEQEQRRSQALRKPARGSQLRVARMS